MQFFNKFALYSQILLIISLIIFSIATFSIVIIIQNDLSQYKALTLLFDDVIEATSSIGSSMIDDNTASIKENLQKLTINPNITSAVVYKYDGQKFIKEFSSPSADKDTTANTPGVLAFLDKKLSIMYPVIKHDQNIGAIEIKTLVSTKYIYSFVEIIFLITLISVFFAMYLSNIITKPIEVLVNAIKAVTNQNDYSIRVQETGNNEIGLLIKSFNGMLETIQHQQSLERSTQTQIRRLAYYDMLTSLPNLELFKELIQQAIENARRNKQLLAILYLDIDNFKSINNTLGHARADNLLKQFAIKLQDFMRQTATNDNINKPVITNLARLNGDEFVMCIQNSTQQDIEEISKALQQELNQTYIIEQEHIKLTASIGISLYPAHGDNLETLIKNAETAMYVSKKTVKGHCKTYDQVLGKIIAARNTLELNLQTALTNNELQAYYQPKYAFDTQRIYGAELLLRWQHPTMGMITPDEFIPIAESSGLIIDIGAWVLSEGCKQCRIWQNSGFKDMHISINLSPQQFADAELIPTVKKAINDSGLDPQYLELELTESTIMASDDKTLSILHKLKSLGLKLSIDDFGTGYSSLRYLTRYPIDIIKIDKSFVSHVIENKNDATITKTIINLAHNLNLFVIAEGVETKEQLEYLNKHRCDAIQGYMLSKPISALDMTNFLDKYGRDTYATGI